MVAVTAKTRTLTNGTTADATPVESNFTELYNNDQTLATAVTLIESGTATLTGTKTFSGTVNFTGHANFGVASDPSSLVDGDIWYNTTTDLIKARVNGATQTILADATGNTSWAHPGNSVGYIISPHLLTTSTVVYSPNTLYYVPVYLRPGSAITKIAAEVTSSSAGNAHLGIYTNGTDGKPSTLLVDGGTVSTGTTGVKEVTISQTLGGWYWLAYVGDAAATLRAAATGSCLLGLRYTTDLQANALAAFTETFSYGALPSTAGTLSAISAANNPPVLGVR